MLIKAFIITTVISVICSVSFLIYTIWLNTTCDGKLVEIREHLVKSGHILDNSTENVDENLIEQLLEIELNILGEEERENYMRVLKEQEKCKKMVGKWTIQLDTQMCLIIGFAATVILWLTFAGIWLYQKRQETKEIDFVAFEDESHGSPLASTAPSGLNGSQEKIIHPEILVEDNKKRAYQQHQTQTLPKTAKATIETKIKNETSNPKLMAEENERKEKDEKTISTMDQMLNKLPYDSGLETPSTTETGSVTSSRDHHDAMMDDDDLPPDYAPPPPPPIED